MAYIPLTKEQYQKAINSGYSPEQIIANEKIRKEKSVGVTSTGMLPVDETQEEQQAKIKEYQAIADKSKKEADFASSPLGMTVNFGKNFGKNIAYPEVSLGNTIAGIGNTKHLESYNKNITDLTTLNINRLKQIEAIESEGKDATALKKQYNQTQQLINENINKIKEIQEGVSKTTGQVLGEIGGTALDALTAGTYGKLAIGARTGILSSIKTPTVKSVSTAISPELGQISTLKPRGLFSKIGIGNVAKGGGVGYSFDVTQNLQEGKTGGEAFTPGLGTVIGFGIPSISESAKSFQQIKNSFTPFSKPFSKPIAGIGQNIKEGFQTIPRVVERVGVGLEESANKATRLKAATPEVKKAIESGLDDKIINFVTEADDVTKDAMKKVVKIAEEKPVLGKTNQPSVVAGDLAVKQYNLIAAEKKRIGKQLGDRINALSKTTTVDIKDSLTSLDDILNSQGILKTYNKKGDVVLDFGTSKFTKVERAKISELYELATEGGSKLTPAQIKAKDQLFSKMQRESKMEPIGDIIIDTPEGQKNLFQAFRDVYNSKLDSIDPTIRELNRKYAEMARITDDIEDSILRTPNFNITKSADPSEFAKVNLRRLFAENQSSATYDAIVKQMDDWARVLGYTDASPKEIMDFSLEMRRLFPETVPKTGFTGGINAGVESTIINTFGKALTSGKPNIIDQQKALKELLGINDVILPKLNKPLNPSSKVNVNLPKAGIEVKNTKTYTNLPKKKVDKVNKVELPRKTAKAEEPLVQEARKYKSADEFVKAQGEEIYHATNAVFNEYNPAQSNDFGTWFAKDKKGLATKDFPILKEEVLKPNTKLITEKQFDKLSNTKKAIDDNRPFPQFYLDKGYKGIDYGDGNIQLWTPNEDIISKSQLTEIWNKANKAEPKKSLPKPIQKTQSIQPKKPSLPKPKIEVKSTTEEALKREAKKYKSADEWIKSLDINYKDSWKGNKDKDADRLLALFDGKVFHGTNAADEIIKNGYKKGNYFNSGAYFSDTPDEAIGYMKQGRSSGGKSSSVLVNDLSNLKIKIQEGTDGDIVRKINKLESGMEEYVLKLKKQGYDGIKSRWGETLVWNTQKIKTPQSLTDIWNKANKNFSKVENPLLNTPKIKSPERINYLERYNINKTELLQDKDVIFTKFFNELKKNEPKFISITEDIASKFGGEYAYRMKSPESISIKMGRRGDKFTLGNVDDALASTVITNDIDGALVKAKKDYKITNVDDFRKKPTFLGYKAVHLDVELPNGQIAEIQLNTRTGLIRKEEGHKTYEKWREYIETAQGTTLEDIVKKVPKDLVDEFLKDVEYSIGIFEGKIPVLEEVKKSVEKRIIKTKNPLSSIMNNKKQPS